MHKYTTRHLSLNVRVFVEDEVVQNKAVQKKTVVLVSIAKSVPANRNSVVLNENMNIDSAQTITCTCPEKGLATSK